MKLGLQRLSEGTVGGKEPWDSAPLFENMLCLTGSHPAQSQKDGSGEFPKFSFAQSALKLDWKFTVCPLGIRRVQLEKNRPGEY